LALIVPRDIFDTVKSETAVPVAEAAEDFLKLLDRVERERKSAVIVREGKPVATLSPVPGPTLTSVELADRCERWSRLPPEEANSFADDLESARRNLPPLRSAWD
jgi:antitoxin (DNA-binding transcriptional repressor) of toxin-antitoxin stability system